MYKRQEPDDYLEIITTFVFSDSQQQNCVNVPINPDDPFEGDENFFGNLATNAPRVTLDPELTEITIVNAESEHG